MAALAATNNNHHAPHSPTDKSGLKLASPPVVLPLPTSGTATTAASISSNPSSPLGAPGALASPVGPAGIQVPVPGSASPVEQQLRLQHLYTLALADRMRFLHNPASILGGPYSPNTAAGLAPLPPRGFPHPPPPDFTHPLYPYGKFDPRLFRLPEEPKPQHSYIGLISMAILSSSDQKLVLADIYQYILDNFPYFRHRGPGWRNSIRHNLSLNDCFIKAGRAANGKGHYWAIHPACIDDFKKGDYRRRKAQRKVRKHMGLAVDEEDSPSPPPPPPVSVTMSAPMLPHAWPHLMHLHPQIPTLPHPPHFAAPPPSRSAPVAGLAAAAAAAAAAAVRQHSVPLSTPQITLPSRKRQFDVASLLGQVVSDDDRDKAKDDDESDEIEDKVARTSPKVKDNSDIDEEDEEQHSSSPIKRESPDIEEDKPSSPAVSEASTSTPMLNPQFPWPIPPLMMSMSSSDSSDASSAPTAPALGPHEYLARYYQLMNQQQQQQQRGLREESD